MTADNSGSSKDTDPEPPVPEIEPEEPDADGNSRGEPWNPDDIRVTTKPYSLRHVCDMIEGEDLDLEPDFQRSDVWKQPQRSRLIESILLRIPLPSFYFDEDRDGRLQVVDGVQRLTAIYEFARRSVPLGDLRYLKTLEGKTYAAIGPTLRRRFDGTQIFANVIDPQTPPKVKFDIFLRLNTGGTQLNAQEIRHCISKNVSRDFLKRCATSDLFQKATGGAFAKKANARMADRELVLRFVAFRQAKWEATYKIKASLDQFLLDASTTLDGMTHGALAEVSAAFDRAMDNAWRLFDGNAFRRWPTSGRRGPINRSLFESWAVVLAEKEWTDIASKKDAIVAEARARMESDEEYISSFTIATTDLRRIHTRFRVVREILAAGAA